jgi:hypothetical protein
VILKSAIPRIGAQALGREADAALEVLDGKRGLPFSAQSTCYPGGVLEQLLTPAQPF